MTRSTSALLILRSVFFSIIIFLLDHTLTLGTSPVILSIVASAGVCLLSWLASTRLTSRGFILLIASAYLLFYSLTFVAAYLPLGSKGHFFITTVISNHLSLCLHTLALTSVLTWLFWKLSYTLTLEILGLIVVALELFRGHRNYHFESPRLLNNLAWEFGLQPLSMLVVAAAVILCLLFIYIYIASLHSRLHFAKDAAGSLFTHGRQNFLLNLSGLALLSTLLFFICSEVFNYYQQEALSRTANGVGQEDGKGMSPLDFHSALGSSNQPAALVRLEGDYKKNPFLPMLYLRENALSDFNGKEMVIGTSGYDDDLNNTTPQQAFEIDEKEDLDGRKQVGQSVFLLSDHKQAFAIDYPVQITPLKNPNSKRFKASYKALSIAPQFELKSIENADLGNPKWPEAVRSYYLRPHPDPRYAEMAMRITNSYASAGKPTARAAFTITNFLNKNATYTLAPNHDVKAGEDPVVPFLFGDMRGYCVHFAHATVYMLRALGIPSRIATGYLTDLSQARDGHVLLRMSDRHAWAEVYLTGLGWVPFDTQPEKVESHADTQIDMKLLEELMGMLDPGDEILPDNLLENEANIQEPAVIWTPSREDIYLALIFIALAYIFTKLFIRYSWALTLNPRKRLQRSYVALAASLCDLGFRRRLGETRQEFRNRVAESSGLSVFSLVDLLNRINYAGYAELSPVEINSIRRDDFKSLAKVPFKKKVAAALSPASVIRFITGNKW